MKKTNKLKILLLGEFSGLHKNLQVGLRASGHHADLVSTGDGFKSIFGNLVAPPPAKGSNLSKLRYRYDYYQFVKRLAGYDIVQLINVNALIGPFFPYRTLLKLLKINNGKVFVLAAGTDAFYWQKARKHLKYGPFEDVLKYDLMRETSPFQTKRFMRFNEYIASRVDGIIPCAYDYFLGYQHMSNIRETIPFPLDLTSVPFTLNKNQGKLKVFHGLNRYGFKGTRHVEAAFSRLNSSNCMRYDCYISGGLPLNDYLKILSQSNVVVDQLNSYSYAMNALYAAAMGKVVISGAETDALTHLKIDKSPIINVKPCSEDLLRNIKAVYSMKDLEEYSYQMRKYVEQYHCCKIISEKYVEQWTR